jgi:DNA-binding CsgD family transcriptional regulator
MTIKNATTDYLDLISSRERDRFTNEPASDYRLAKIIGISASAVSNYRRRGGGFDNATCWRVADILGIDPREVIAAVERDRAKDDSMRKVWEGRLAVLGGKAAALAVCSILLQAAMPGEARAATLSGGLNQFTSINILVRRTMHKIASLLHFDDAGAHLARA